MKSKEYFITQRQLMFIFKRSIEVYLCDHFRNVEIILQSKKKNGAIFRSFPGFRAGEWLFAILLIVTELNLHFPPPIRGQEESLYCKKLSGLFFIFIVSQIIYRQSCVCGTPVLFWESKWDSMRTNITLSNFNANTVAGSETFPSQLSLTYIPVAQKSHVDTIEGNFTISNKRCPW